MLQPATLKFLQSLEKNNNREWFEANKEKYQAAKEDFEQFVTSLNQSMAELEPALEGQQAKNNIFRIFRDVRFSKDKTPYKAHFSGYFSKGGRKWAGAGYYVHVQPGGKSFLATGIWMPEGPLLKAIRQEIDYDFPAFQKILAEKNFKKQFGAIKGESLQKVPAGYDAENPAVDYLKMKSFIANAPLPDDIFGKKDVVKTIAKSFATAKPFVAFLNRSLD